MKTSFEEKNEQQQFLLPSDEETVKRESDHCTIRRNLVTDIVAIVLTATIGLLLGGLIGRAHGPARRQHGLLSMSLGDCMKDFLLADTLAVPSGDENHYFYHNLTFTERPSDESERAWASIIPVGRGFIHHEPLAPTISNIAVFHQLHCLVSASNHLKEVQKTHDFSMPS